MFLLIDIGNTRIKWAAADDGAAPGQWRAGGAVRHDEAASLGLLWRDLPITHAIATNVGVVALREQVGGMLHVAVEWFESSAQAAGLRNGYRDPARLGSDRFAAAIGARALYPSRALVVVNCGTATTIDAVDGDGLFVGGMILPGLQLMRSSLARHTARLPAVDPLRSPAALFADNTEDAIAAGCLQAQIGAVERACAEHGRRYGEPLCVVSGGAAPAVLAGLPKSCVHVDNLVLIGLQAYAASRGG